MTFVNSIVRRVLFPLVLIVALAGVGAVTPVSAHGGGHFSGGGHGYGRHAGGGHYRGGGWGGGVGWGGGWGFGYDPLWNYYGYDYPYDYYAGAPAASVIQPTMPATPPASQSYYYCGNPAGYYPYVATCQTPWQSVPVAPTR
jgi:hypothetical protein